MYVIMNDWVKDNIIIYGEIVGQTAKEYIIDNCYMLDFIDCKREYITKKDEKKTIKRLKSEAVAAANTVKELLSSANFIIYEDEDDDAVAAFNTKEVRFINKKDIKSLKGKGYFITALTIWAQELYDMQNFIKKIVRGDFDNEDNH